MEALLAEKTSERVPDGGSSIFQRLRNWVTVEAPAEDPIGASPSRDRSRQIRKWWAVLTVAVVGIVAIIMLVHVAHTPGQGSPSQATTTPATGSTPSTTASPNTQGSSSAAASSLSSQQEADIHSARQAMATSLRAKDLAENVTSTASRVSQNVSSLAQQALQLSAPALARNPDAADPQAPLAQASTALAHLTQLQADLQQDLKSVQDAAARTGSLAKADDLPQVSTANTTAQQDLHTLTVLSSDLHAYVAQASAEAQQANVAYSTWQGIHTAASGYLGIGYQDPPGDWSVSGCEVTDVPAGTPAASTPLTGSAQRLDPVGDVIQEIVDSTDSSASWTIASCADLDTALQYTRAGDEVTIYYQHRVSAFPTGYWVPETTTAVLTQAP